MQTAAQDRRQEIIEAGIAVLREHGFAGFTQPRVAAKAGVRQSHLTYYFPTRADLLTAVARVAIDRQLAAVDMIASLPSPSTGSASKAIASVGARHENTRVIMALAQGADQEPAVREIFRELADGIAVRAGRLLEQLNIAPTAEHCYLLHAMSVGMAVIGLATAREGGERRSADALETALKLMQRGSQE